MRGEITLTIDGERCTGCGACVRVCPVGTISVEDGTAAVTGDHSINCGHCQAVCPTEAIEVGALDPDVSAFATFEADHSWLAPGETDVTQLVRLMASRRSFRNYTDETVARDILDDLVKVGITAPSGTNSQRWTFTILPERKDVLVFGRAVTEVYRKLNRLAEKWWLRSLLRLVGKPELQAYYEGYYESIKGGIEEFERTGRDLLFRGAPAVIVVAMRPGASCGPEDALLASQNILLAAHAMGLGTCLIGFAVAAMKRDRGPARAIGIPDDEVVYAVIALGHPDETYERTAGRLAPLVRYHPRREQGSFQQA